MPKSARRSAPATGAPATSAHAASGPADDDAAAEEDPPPPPPSSADEALIAVSMLSGLTSPWAMPRACRWARAAAAWRAMERRAGSGRGPPCTAASVARDTPHRSSWM